MTRALPITLAMASLAATLSVPMETRESLWVDRRGTKRKRHGKVAERRAKSKAARAARKKARR